MDAKQGVDVLKLIEPELAIPLHFNDYSVFKSPPSAFSRTAREAGLEDRVHYWLHGDTYTFAPAMPVSR